MKKIIFLVFILVLVYLIMPVKTLIISGNKTAVFSVDDDFEFKISFIHSVELCRWIEIYRVEGNEIHLIETLTKSAGWGLPSTGNFSFKVVNGEGWMSYKMDRRFKSITISTSKFNNYELIFDNKTLKLDVFGKLVTIEVKSLPRFALWGWNIGS